MGSTLRGGVSEDEINEIERRLKVKLPLSTRLIYRFCNGQERHLDKLFGVIGGCYHASNHTVNVNLLCLEEVVWTTENLKRHIAISKYIVIAASFIAGFAKKVFLLNCANGQLYVTYASTTGVGEMMPCVPKSLLIQEDDGFLLWLEEHVNRLQTSMITVRENDNVKVFTRGDLKGISQYPQKPPLCTTTVVNGLQISLSAMFVPEQSSVQNSNFGFAFTIRISVLPDGCNVYGIKFNSCRLHWMHWIIRENENAIEDYSQEAYFAKSVPLLPGGKGLVREYIRYLRKTPGSIECSFTFVPGRMAPERDSFNVEVPPLLLEMPMYMY